MVRVTNAEKSHDGGLIKVNGATGEMTLFAHGFFEGWLYPAILNMALLEREFPIEGVKI